MIDVIEQRPDTMVVEDLKELRYLECVVKVSSTLRNQTTINLSTTTGTFYVKGALPRELFCSFGQNGAIIMTNYLSSYTKCP